MNGTLAVNGAPASDTRTSAPVRPVLLSSSAQTGSGGTATATGTQGPARTDMRDPNNLAANLPQQSPSDPLKGSSRPGALNNQTVLSYLPEYEGQATSSLATRSGESIVIPKSYNAFLDIMLNSVKKGDTTSAIGALRKAAAKFHTSELLGIPVSTISKLGDTPNDSGLIAVPAIGGKINGTAAAVNKPNATYDPFTDIGAGIVAVLQGIGMGDILGADAKNVSRPENSLINGSAEDLDKEKANELKQWIEKNPAAQEALQQFANVVKDIVSPALTAQQSGPGLQQLSQDYSALQPKSKGSGSQPT